MKDVISKGLLVGGPKDIRRGIMREDGVHERVSFIPAVDLSCILQIIQGHLSSDELTRKAATKLNFFDRWATRGANVRFNQKNRAKWAALVF